MTEDKGCIFVVYTEVAYDIYIFVSQCVGGSKGYSYQAGSYTPVVTFDLVAIPQWLEVIPQWLVVIPQQGKFKASQSIIKKCVNTQVTICEEQQGTMDCFVVSYQKLRYKQVISHYTCGISLLFTLYLGFASASCNNNDIPLVV